MVDQLQFGQKAAWRSETSIFRNFRRGAIYYMCYRGGARGGLEGL